MTHDRDEQFHVDDEEQRINELKRQAADAAGGEMTSIEYDVPGAPPGLREQFWKSVLAWEQAPWTSPFEQLRKKGIDLPPPEQLDDHHLPGKLRELIDALARQNVFLDHTDHLSDRQLYEHLYHETLHEATKDVPFNPDAFCSIDLLGAGSEADVLLLAKFYADDQQREMFRESFPDGLRDREDPPFDRDRTLPKPPESPR